MRRRHALQGVAGFALALAGCAGPSETADRTYSVGETATVEPVGDITVTGLTVQRSVSVDYLGLTVHEPAAGQVLVVELADRLGGDDPAPFIARFDGERVDPPTEVSLSGPRPRAAVAVPVRAVEQAAVVFDRGEAPAWTVPDGEVAKLGAAPEFSLQRARFDHAAEELTLVVGNSGDRDGTFRGGVDFGNDYTTPVAFPVAAGERRTERVELSPPWEPTEDREFDVTADTRVLWLDR